MIGIKKVQVVPLDENYAKIIDSFNTTDDKTKNAPSIHAVEEKLSELHTDINSDITDTNNNVTDLSNSAMLKENFALITGTITAGAQSQGNTSVSYPTGFTKDNCVIISIMGRRSDASSSLGFATPVEYDRSLGYSLGSGGLHAVLYEDNISVRWWNMATDSKTSTFKLVLMKTDFDDISDYELGDINMDGEVTQADHTLLQNYLNGSGSLTGKQYKLADMNEDGVLNSADLLLLQQKING